MRSKVEEDGTGSVIGKEQDVMAPLAVRVHAEDVHWFLASLGHGPSHVCIKCHGMLVVDCCRFVNGQYVE